MDGLRNSDKIFVAGHRGLVGGAIVNSLRRSGFNNILARTRDELDLTNTEKVQAFFKQENPDVVIIAAARVGGIHANNTYRADFIYDNLQIQTNLIWGAHLNDVRRVCFLGSSCIYPRLAPQPMPENCLLTSELEYTNRPYALAKIAGLELVSTLRQQYQRDYFSVMPTNLYGPGDNFHPQNAHVLPALILRFWEAREKNAPQVVIWGSGKPFREFMYVDDCADAIVHLLRVTNQKTFDNTPVGKLGWSHVNVGTGQEISIAEVAQAVAAAVGYKGEIVQDTSMPDGTPRKLLDTSFLRSLGWQPKTTLQEGLAKTVAWFADVYKSNPKLLRK